VRRKAAARSSKQPGANVIDTADQIKARLPRLTANLPPAMTVQTIFDRTDVNVGVRLAATIRWIFTPPLALTDTSAGVGALLALRAGGMDLSVIGIILLIGGPSGLRIQPNFSREPALPPARAVVYERLATGTCRVSANWRGWRRFQKSRCDA
jgi:hypothetical protein